MKFSTSVFALSVLVLWSAASSAKTDTEGNGSVGSASIQNEHDTIACVGLGKNGAHTTMAFKVPAIGNTTEGHMDASMGELDFSAKRQSQDSTWITVFDRGNEIQSFEMIGDQGFGTTTPLTMSTSLRLKKNSAQIGRLFCSYLEN